jgi:hypothetical protein
MDQGSAWPAIPAQRGLLAIIGIGCVWLRDSELVQEGQSKLVKPLLLIPGDRITGHSDNIDEAYGGFVKELPQTLPPRFVERRAEVIPL